MVQVTVVDGPALLRDLRSLDSLADRRLAASAADERQIADLIVDQIEFANLLLLNKCDLLPQVRPAAIAACNGISWVCRGRSALLFDACRRMLTGQKRC